MRLLITVSVIVMLASTAYAADIFFTNTETSQLVVLSIENGKAIIRDPQGERAEVVPGDRVGKEGGTVAEIGGSSIVVTIGTTKMKLTIAEVFKKR